MIGAFYVVLAIVLFGIAIAVPLFAMRWKSFAIVMVVGVVCFWWLTIDIQAGGTNHWLGPFLGGLLLFGFAGGAIAKFVMLLSGSREATAPPKDDQSGPGGP